MTMVNSTSIIGPKLNPMVTEVKCVNHDHGKGNLSAKGFHHGKIVPFSAILGHVMADFDV